MNIAQMWESRYAKGGDSGRGSRGVNARIKAERINRTIVDHGIVNVVDWGCGDGQVASLIDADCYLGVDPSRTALNRAVDRCGRRPGWSWLHIELHRPPVFTVDADLSLSCDVIFHLTDERSYRQHLGWLFTAPRVLVHATDYDTEPERHMRHHRFTDDVPSNYRLLSRPDDPHTPGFYEFAR